MQVLQRTKNSLNHVLSWYTGSLDLYCPVTYCSFSICELSMNQFISCKAAQSSNQTVNECKRKTT